MSHILSPLPKKLIVCCRYCCVSTFKDAKNDTYDNTAHTHTMETHSMEKVPSMENFSINQTE